MHLLKYFVKLNLFSIHDKKFEMAWGSVSLIQNSRIIENDLFFKGIEYFIYRDFRLSRLDCTKFLTKYIQ